MGAREEGVMRVTTTVAVLAVAATAALAPAAQASTATGGATVRYAAAPGEKNHVTATLRPGGVYSLADPSANVTAGADCVQVDVHTVTCTGDGKTLAVDLGDGDDSFETE